MHRPDVLFLLLLVRRIFQYHCDLLLRGWRYDGGRGLLLDSECYRDAVTDSFIKGC